jgi:hypothetical protein
MVIYWVTDLIVAYFFQGAKQHTVAVEFYMVPFDLRVLDENGLIKLVNW